MSRPLLSEIYHSLPFHSLYSHLTLHIVPGPRSLSYFLPPLIVFLSLLLPRRHLPSSIVRWVILPALLAIECHTSIKWHSFSVISVNNALMAWMLLAHYDPRRDFTRVKWEWKEGEQRWESRIEHWPGEGMSADNKDDGKAKEENGLEKSSGSSNCKRPLDSERMGGRLHTKTSERTEDHASEVEIPPAKLTQQRSVSISSSTVSLCGLTTRAQWAGLLLSSLQLKNFLIASPASHDRLQISSPPPSPRTAASYRSFTVSLVLRSVCVYLLLDLTSYLINQSSIRTFRAIADPALLTTLPSATGTATASSAPAETAVRALCLMTHLGAALALYTGYFPLAVLSVALLPLPSLHFNSFVSPYMANPHFGPMSAIWGSTGRSTGARSVSDRGRSRTWGLRAFWGTFWHGNMRYYTSTPGVSLSDALRLPRHSGARYALVVCSAFFFSGVVHAGMVPPFPLGTDPGWTAHRLRIRVGAFFWLQILGIGIETAFDGLASGHLRRRRRRRRRKSATPPTPFRCSAPDAAVPTATGENGATPAELSHAPRIRAQSVVVKEAWQPLTQLAAAAWFIAFFSGSMYLTLLPVGQQLGWWSMPAVPVSFVRWVMGREQWWEGLDWPAEVRGWVREELDSRGKR